MCLVGAELKSCGRRVPLIIVVDANLMQPIPPNVDKCLNLYVTNKLGVFHGSPVYPESGCTEIVNWDVSQGQPSMFVGGVNHFDIDSTDWVHQIIIDEIDAMFGPPASPLFEFGQRRPLPHRAATVTGRQRVTLAPAAPHRPDGLGDPSSAVAAGAAPGWSEPPAASPGQAGNDVRWQTPRERDPAGPVTPTNSADLAGTPSTGLRLRFASPIDSSLRVADQRMPAN